MTIVAPSPGLWWAVVWGDLVPPCGAAEGGAAVVLEAGFLFHLFACGTGSSFCLWVLSWAAQCSSSTGWAVGCDPNLPTPQARVRLRALHPGCAAPTLLLQHLSESSFPFACRGPSKRPASSLWSGT